jgi:hypothetical protein
MIICCGSKKYYNINFDNLVDSFDTIVRHGFLIPNCGYGKRDSTVQVLNSHEITNFHKLSTADEWINTYASSFGIDHEYMKKYVDYIYKENLIITHYPNNNKPTIVEILKKHKIDHPYLNHSKFNKNGLAQVADCVIKDIKPFLIGYSILDEDIKKHVYNGKAQDFVNDHHEDNLDCSLIIKLHENNLIDASFCAINDDPTISFNNIIKPTEQALEILKKHFLIPFKGINNSWMH